MIAGSGRDIGSVIASIEASAHSLAQAAEKIGHSKSESFGAKISEAVKRKLRSRQPVIVGATADGFGDKIKKAVQRKVKARSFRPRPRTASN